jgi:hypothetical protein
MQACARGVVTVATAGVAARATTVSQMLTWGKVGMESTSEARPTCLARWEALALTLTTARREEAEGRQCGDVS